MTGRALAISAATSPIPQRRSIILMFIIITLLLTVLVSGIFGAVPAVVSRRRVSRRDAAWAAGLWLAVWVFALCAYHRPG